MGMLVATYRRSSATTVNSSYGQNTLVQSVMFMLYVEQGALILISLFLMIPSLLFHQVSYQLLLSQQLHRPL